MAKVVEKPFEEHLLFRYGAHIDIWHRFRKPSWEERGKQQTVVLRTRCNKRIYDHWNVKSTYSRNFNHCGDCFPHGITSEGLPKPSKRDQGDDDEASDAGGEGHSPTAESGSTGEGQALTSTAEPLVSDTPDGGDGGATSSEGSGVLGAGHSGHVEELPVSGETGDQSTGRSADPEGGQGSPVREHPEGQPKQPAGAKRGPKTGAS